jgi:hypothetical protein
MLLRVALDGCRMQSAALGAEVHHSPTEFEAT